MWGHRAHCGSQYIYFSVGTVKGAAGQDLEEPTMKSTSASTLLRGVAVL